MSRVWIAIALVVWASGCAHIGNVPVNQPATDASAGLSLDPKLAVGAEGRAAAESKDDLLISLSFSGGGTRAAAFSFGVLQGLDRSSISARGRQINLVDHVDFVSGVSGGSLTAAYFGLKKRAALTDFRERFLIKNAEENLNTAVTLANLGRGLGGGINEDIRLRTWLDTNLFEGATFSKLAGQRPTVWINATDIYNGTPFLFLPLQFSAICSDLGNYPISAAVAASAAVPVVFDPIIIETFPERCQAKLPDWLARAQSSPKASPLIKAFARSIQRQTDGTMKYIKLVDGGLVDNYGLSGFTIAREGAQTPYGPLTPGEAVRMRRMLFLTVDAGAESKKDWAQKLEGPSGAQLISAITDASIDAASRLGFSAFNSTMLNWREALIRWRCGLPTAEVTKMIGVRAWNCRDLKFSIGRISFDDLEKSRADRLKRVETRFKLSAETVDEVIVAGQDALLRANAYRSFIASF